MRIITCVFLQCICLCFSSAQTIEPVVQKQRLRLHSVAISANLFPFFPEAPFRSIPTELPIGRFQPSISLYRGNPDKWLDISLLALRPGLSEYLLDTSTISFFGLPPTLTGSAGSYEIFHIALGVAEGRLNKSKIFGRRTTMEYGALLGFKQTKFTNTTSIFPNVKDYKYTNPYTGINFALGFHLVNKSKFCLNLKLQNYFTFGIDRRFFADGTLFSTIYDIDGSFLVPMVQARLLL